MLKLTREQELKLISIGLKYLLSFEDITTHDEKITPKNSRKYVKRTTKRKSRKWSPEQHAKFKASMKRVWAKRKEAA